MRPVELLKLLRPYQWSKNGFVFIGLVFGHVYGDWAVVTRVLYAAAGFCLVSSCVYVLNDIFDRESDRAHPIKRKRPLASGSIGLPAAGLLAAVAGSAGLLLGAAASAEVAGIMSAYLLLNLAYSAGLKNVVILDVFIIAAGFMLRIYAGTWGVGIAPSHWLLLCGLMLTVFLGFAKRRAELMVGTGDGGSRAVLQHYSTALLDTMISVCAAGVIVSYSLYTVSADTIALHHTENLIYTVPLVTYGVFRYIYRLHRRGGGEDPAWALLTDPHLILVGIAWLFMTIFLLR
jgi:4-hydroxybenzoate polyprenyltransferase